MKEENEKGKIMKLKKTIWILIGLLAGLLTGYVRGFHPMSFWTLSDLAAKYGFWIFTVSLIAYFAKEEKEARLHSFFYMAAMCISYYGYLYFVKNRFYGKQFLFWVLFAIAASVYAGFIKKAADVGGKYEVIICSIPIILLGIEFADLCKLFLSYHTNFLQLVIDLAGVITLFLLFMKKKDGKFRLAFFFTSIGTIAAVCGFFLILWSF